MVFGRNFCEKRRISVSEPHFGKVIGDARPWLWLVGKPMVDFLFALIELFFAIYYGSGVMRRNVHSSSVFTGGHIFVLEILP